MTPIFITDVFLVSADRKREDDDLTELSVPKLPAPDPSGPLPHGNNALSALIVIPEGFCRGSVVSQENSNDDSNLRPSRMTITTQEVDSETSSE